jgi:hypothetical protein
MESMEEAKGSTLFLAEAGALWLHGQDFGQFR